MKVWDSGRSGSDCLVPFYSRVELRGELIMRFIIHLRFTDLIAFERLIKCLV